MTTEPLLTISAFARAVDLAPSTLRYYDEAGLLPPAEVDPRSGYRYYTPGLERRATLLRRMRELGLSVDTMRVVLAATPTDAARILRDHAEGARRSAELAAAVVDEILTGLDAPGSGSGADRLVVTVDGPELAAALRRVVRAASPREDHLGVVLLDVAQGALTVVATDRYWLARWSVPLAESCAGEHRVVVASDSVAAMADRLDRVPAAALSLDDGRVEVGDGDSVTTVSTEPDRFPAYRLVLPDDADGRATMRTDALRSAARGVEEGPVRLELGADRARLGGYGDAAQRPLAAVTDGPPTTLWFSRDLLLAALDTLVGESVTMAWTAPHGAVRLTPVEQRRLEVVLMPVRPPA